MDSCDLEGHHTMGSYECSQLKMCMLGDVMPMSVMSMLVMSRLVMLISVMSMPIAPDVREIMGGAVRSVSVRYYPTC